MEMESPLGSGTLLPATEPVKQNSPKNSRPSQIALPPERFTVELRRNANPPRPIKLQAMRSDEPDLAYLLIHLPPSEPFSVKVNAREMRVFGTLGPLEGDCSVLTICASAPAALIALIGVMVYPGDPERDLLLSVPIARQPFTVDLDGQPLTPALEG